MKYTTNAYLITCLTNMHVGSGGANYGVVDNLVQRDSITNVPTINSSSLKGALREFFKNEWNEDDKKLNHIFGPDTGREGKDAGIGHYKIFPADLLVLPVRSNKKPFFRATSQMLIDTIKTKITAFGNNLSIADYINDDKDHPKIKENSLVRLEDWNTITYNAIADDENLGENLAVFHNDTFKILAKKLPVIARNQLDNGESKNLWYEEIVPRESRFVFFVSIPNDDSKKDELDAFEKVFEQDSKKVIQIGANASIGYGYCKITKIS